VPTTRVIHDQEARTATTAHAGWTGQTDEHPLFTINKHKLEDPEWRERLGYARTRRRRPMNTDANTDFAEEPDQEEPLDGEEEPEETRQDGPGR